ncbi:DUF4062 domain-containing protein [Salinisphaera sp. Q1T1-3]|uniref:DUF4062 domain-containing protein n=1 Tax=Salinisphaera sp. Q1T1-3 TaxID=2321229 RepID=UPI000E737D3E|nr:DUF4062 domain-containing protein [Salinisphaera sp. Q1T1-3]RJS91143.1 DUF4062 domain-containing protein [Salinisphaera sp. Q1T1-3]
MRTVFISSVIEGYQEIRQAARRAVEIMGFKPITVETDLPAKAYSPEQACLTEVSQADMYIVIAGERFGYRTDSGLSVTQTEYREAQKTQRPTLVFIEQVQPEADQESFIDELQDYAAGLFRRTFSSPDELKDEIVQALRQLDENQRAASEKDFQRRLEQATASHQHARWSSDPNQPTLTAAWWPQPPHDIDLSRLENHLDDYFDIACAQGLLAKRAGYESVSGPDHVGFASQDHQIRLFEDGLILYRGIATPPQTSRHNPLSGMFVAPSQIRAYALAASHLFDATGAWCHIALTGMSNKHFAEPPSAEQRSMSMPMMATENVARNRCLIPYTSDRYQQFIDRAIDQFGRELSHRF